MEEGRTGQDTLHSEAVVSVSTRFSRCFIHLPTMLAAVPMETLFGGGNIQELIS